MNDEKIIKMYKEGFSIDYIANSFHRYRNRDLKPVKINGIVLYPVKIYTKADCRLYVIETIYKYLINGDMAHTQTAAQYGRGAF